MVWYKTGGSGPAVFGAPLGQASWHGLARYGTCNFKRVELYFLFFDFVHAFHFDVTANSFTVKGDGVRRGKWKSCKCHASRFVSIMRLDFMIDTKLFQSHTSR